MASNVFIRLEIDLFRGWLLKLVALYEERDGRSKQAREGYVGSKAIAIEPTYIPLITLIQRVYRLVNSSAERTSERVPHSKQQNHLFHRRYQRKA